MPGRKGMTHYSIEIKKEAIRLFFEEGITQREISEKLEIRDSYRVRRWVKDFRQAGNELYTRNLGRPRKVMDEKAYYARLEMENKILKKLQSELQKDMLARRDIGRFTTTEKNTK
jgi:transposase